MTAFDRAFIKAYMPQDAAAVSQQAAPSSVTTGSTQEALDVDLSAHPETKVVSPMRVANRKSVMAALEQPLRSTIGSVAKAANPAMKNSVSELKSEPIASPAADAIQPEPLSLHSVPSQASSSDHCSEIVHDGASAHPTLSSFMKLREMAAQAELHGEPALADTDAAQTMPREIVPQESCEVPAKEAFHRLGALNSSAIDSRSELQPGGEPSPAVLPWGVLGPDAAKDPLGEMKEFPASTASVQGVFSTCMTSSDAESMEPTIPLSKPFEADASSLAETKPAVESSDPVETPPAPLLSLWKNPFEQEQQESDEKSLFHPAWQVEQFTWPRVCRRLFAKASEEIDQLADSLLAAGQRGHKVLAMSGWHAGEGASTILLCVARRLAERGVMPVLIDADLARPRLAKRLGVKPQTGWNRTVIRGQETSLNLTIVESTNNKIALAPACEPVGEECFPAAGLSQLSDCIELVRPHYDLVLVDLGPLEDLCEVLEEQDGGIFHGVDSLVLVRDGRLTSLEQLGEIQGQLRSARITVAGVVENFVDA